MGHADALIDDADLVRRVEHTTALDAAAVAAPLAALEPGLAPTAVALAGGQVVLLGPGMYVNRGMGMGLGVEVTGDDLDSLMDLCERASVAAEVEISPWAHPSLLTTTADRGLRPAWFRSTLLRSLSGDEPMPSSAIVIDRVGDGAGLAVWQQTAALGFEYSTPAERRISDLFAAAVHSIPGSSLCVARIDGRAVAVASLTVRDRMASLGGMATVPSARRQGVQSALVQFRLAVAARSGCDIAVSSAVPGSASERNLLRGGLTIIYSKLGVRRRFAG